MTIDYLIFNWFKTIFNCEDWKNVMSSFKCQTYWFSIIFINGFHYAMLKHVLMAL